MSGSNQMDSQLLRMGKEKRKWFTANLGLFNTNSYAQRYIASSAVILFCFIFTYPRELEYYYIGVGHLILIILSWP